MSNEVLGRLSVSCMVAVVAGVALLSQSVWSTAPIPLWLVYTVGCGVLLNTKRGEKPLHLALYSLAPAIVPLVALLYPLITGDPLVFSGLEASSLRFRWLLLFFVVVSWLGIFLFSFGRVAVLGLLRWVARGKGAAWLATAETTVRALIGLLAALALLVAALSCSGSRRQHTPLSPRQSASPSSVRLAGVAPEFMPFGGKRVHSIVDKAP